MALCLSVSVCHKSCSVEMAKGIELVFGMGACFHLSYTVLKRNSSTFKDKGTSLWNFVPDSGLFASVYRSSKRVIDLARHGGHSEREKLDRRRSTKLTIPPSADARSL